MKGFGYLVLVQTLFKRCWKEISLDIKRFLVRISLPINQKENHYSWKIVLAWLIHRLKIRHPPLNLKWRISLNGLHMVRQVARKLVWGIFNIFIEFFSMVLAALFLSHFFYRFVYRLFWRLFFSQKNFPAIFRENFSNFGDFR